MMPPGMPSGMGPPVMPGLGSAMQGVPVGDPVAQRAPPPHATMAPTAGFVPGDQPQAFYPPLPDVAPADPKTVPAGQAASATSVPPASEPAPAPAAEAAAAAPPAASEPAGAS